MQAKLDRINISKNGEVTHTSNSKTYLLLPIALFIEVFHFCVYPNEETLVECYKPLGLALLRSLSQETAAKKKTQRDNNNTSLISSVVERLLHSKIVKKEEANLLLKLEFLEQPANV